MHHIIETVRGNKMIINVLGNEEGARSFHAFAQLICWMEQQQQPAEAVDVLLSQNSYAVGHGHGGP